jgi:hypothetical protein
MRALDDWDNFHHDLAASLTEAAYPVALQHHVGNEWLDLELELWKVLSETVRKWERQVPRTGSPDDFQAWREGLLVEVTELALHVGARHGMKAPLSEVELDFYQAFRLVLREITWLRWSRSLHAASQARQPVGCVSDQ